MITDHFLPTLIFSILSGLYSLMLILIYSALRNLKHSHMTGGDEKISVIIAARNESAHIQNCLESLSRLEYRKDRFEIVLVDDDSTDNTAEIIDQYCQKYENWHLVRIRGKSHELKGKKNALQQGINKASGDLIFTTDADCIVNPLWLKTMIKYFRNDVAMVIGFSPVIRGKGFFHRLIEFDTLFSAIVAAASNQLGYPYTSTGRNLAYRKRSYLKSGGFLSLKKYRSGDDMHLTRRFRDEKMGKISYCADPGTFVQTFPPESIAHFFQQQIRKNSKILQSGPATGFIVILIFIYHVLLYLLPFLFTKVILLWFFFVMLRLALESITLISATRIFNQTHLISFLPVAQIIYPLFIIFFGILGIPQKYKWKN